MAFAAKLLGVKATIVIPDNAPQVKVDGIRKLGACLLYTSFLVVKDEEGRLQPSLATSWENVDDTTIRFTLRDDVVFHNGEKMTAEDVRYTLVRASEKSGSAPLFQSVDTENTKAVSYTHLLSGMAMWLWPGSPWHITWIREGRCLSRSICRT